MANSTVSALRSLGRKFLTYCFSGTSESDNRLSRKVSPQTPRVFTLPMTRFRSLILEVICWTSTRPLLTVSRRSETCLKLSPRRVSKVFWSFSPTTSRISLRRRSLSARMSSSAFSTFFCNSVVLRAVSAEKSATDFTDSFRDSANAVTTSTRDSLRPSVSSFRSSLACCAWAARRRSVSLLISSRTTRAMSSAARAESSGDVPGFLWCKKMPRPMALHTTTRQVMMVSISSRKATLPTEAYSATPSPRVAVDDRMITP